MLPTPSSPAELLARLSGAIRLGSTQSSLDREDDRLATGYPELDRLLGGGLPRGSLSEVVSRRSSGATSLLHRLLAGATTRDHYTAWVDAADAFDPASADAAGIDLERVLWVRPPSVAAAFSAAEIVTTTGGFALVLLDAAGGATDAKSEPAAGGRQAAMRRAAGGMPAAPHTWIRLARAAAQYRTALVVLTGAGGQVVGTSPGVRLELSAAQVVWQGALGTPRLLEGWISRVDIRRCRGMAGERQVQIRQR